MTQLLVHVCSSAVPRFILTTSHDPCVYTFVVTQPHGVSVREAEDVRVDDQTRTGVARVVQYRRFLLFHKRATATILQILMKYTQFVAPFPNRQFRVTISNWAQVVTRQVLVNVASSGRRGGREGEISGNDLFGGAHVNFKIVECVKRLCGCSSSGRKRLLSEI